MSDSANGPQAVRIDVSADSHGVIVRVEGANPEHGGTVTIPLEQALSFLRKFEAALRPVAPAHAEATAYLDLDGAAAEYPEFSDEEILVSLYAEPVEDPEEFERRTLVMRRVMATLHACSGISTIDLKRMVSLSRLAASEEHDLTV